MKPESHELRTHFLEMTAAAKGSLVTNAAGNICEVHWLGQVEYTQAWALQKQMAEEIGSGQRPPTLLLLEHPPTITFGRSGKPANLLWDEAELSRRAIKTLWVDRGGDITYHGPGQLVGYPLLPLKPGGLQAGTLEGRIPQADYLGYLHRLETTLVQALGHIGVRAHTIPGHTGVWVDQPEQATGALTPAKVAAIGVKVGANGVSQHGFALNINPDMEAWQGIIPCGIENCRVTSLAELLSTCPYMRLVCKRVMESFAQVFNFELRIV